MNSSNFNFSQQERGLYPDDFDIDEETRFSSVYRGKGVDDEYDENEDNFLDSQNSETFGDISDSVIKRPGKVSGGKGKNGAQTWSNFSTMVSLQPVIYKCLFSWFQLFVNLKVPLASELVLSCD